MSDTLFDACAVEKSARLSPVSDDQQELFPSGGAA